MINRRFKEDWLQLLKVNQKINNSEKPEEIKETIRIPFTNLQIDAYLFYYLLQYLYPKFINDQRNLVDFIISDYDIDNIAFDAYLYNTKRLGIYDSVDAIPKDTIKFNQKEMDNLEDLFIKIQSNLLETNKVRIASVRFFRKRGIDLINRYYDKLDKYSTFEFFTHLLDLIQKLIKEELLIIYPEPNIIKFLKSIFILFGNLKFSEIFKKGFNLLPVFNQTLLFHSNKIDFILKFSKQKTSTLKLVFKETILDQDPLAPNLNKKELTKLQKKFKSPNIIILKFESLVDYLLEVSELRYPVEKDKLKLLIQKILYAFTTIETQWNITPQPRIYNSLVRFLTRLFGFNINLKKISYWAIPDCLYYFMDTYLGLNYKLALLLTDKENPKQIISIACHNGAPIEVLPIDHMEIINTEEITTLSSIWNIVSKQYGFHAMLIKIDIALIQKLIDTFLFTYHKLGFFSFLTIIRMVKQPKYFEIYPELPPFQLIKKKNALMLLKVILDNIVDRFEF